MRGRALDGQSLVLGCAPAAAQVFRSSAGSLAVETIASGLDHPWGVAFLPDGRLLVTERPGRMRVVGKDGKLSPALAGVPKVFASSQGGLLDVALDRGYARATRRSISAMPIRWTAARAPRLRAPGWWTKARPGSPTSR